MSDATDDKLTMRYVPAVDSQGCPDWTVPNWTVVFTHDSDDLLMRVDPDSTENNQADFEIRLSPSP